MVFLGADISYQKLKLMFGIKFNIAILGKKKLKLTAQFKTVFFWIFLQTSFQRLIYMLTFKVFSINTQIIYLQ